MSRGRPGRAQLRDTQDASTFTLILQQLLRVTPSSVGAALVDRQGETVDYAGYLDPFDLKVAAAHWQIVLSTFDAEKLGTLRQITVRARAKSYVVRQVATSYAVVLILHRSAAFAVSERALLQADDRLCSEAGWPFWGERRWSSVEVAEVDSAYGRSPSTPAPTDGPKPVNLTVNAAKKPSKKRDRARPLRVRAAGDWLAIDVLGSLVGLRTGERGYRVRLATGREMTLVRERDGRWFADEHIE